ncbi:TIGR03085 family metal-binding protein [Cellulomonas shaoxiangyii]|uniref:TIGR03085 family protein n=1 Tax=Cellulomonas shaoxiangyii TaxID=2566013 RepID=A0A4P7SHH0_9CELL|nr:TIGR03085 family metal-binding protein [Cellulomonas shaoxiangyii]QCB93462.1 TIGR03085 family protein [Cellulomonas shaoxiangyii]TGY86784.1 TIGR03085 family protein [Cellulomonas shaoxiangyii]
MTWHETERAWLADTLRGTAFDAPTLCDGWQARHLAAHLVLREKAPRAGAGAVRTAATQGPEAATQRLAASVDGPTEYLRLVDAFATPPRRWSPLAWAGDAVNASEYFIHTEDLRRGAGHAEPRALPEGLRELLWRQLVRMAPVRLRRLGPGVVLVRSDDLRSAVHRPRAGHGTVVLRGDVGELVLAVSGRLQAADVALEGAPADVAAVRELLSGP